MIQLERVYMLFIITEWKMQVNVIETVTDLATSLQCTQACCFHDG